MNRYPDIRERRERAVQAVIGAVLIVGAVIAALEKYPFIASFCGVGGLVSLYLSRR
jgi:hypothetical protein